MKKRITCMLLVLCMVLAAVPTALAGQAAEDQLDFSLLRKAPSQRDADSAGRVCAEAAGRGRGTDGR